MQFNCKQIFVANFTTINPSARGRINVACTNAKSMFIIAWHSISISHAPRRLIWKHVKQFNIIYWALYVLPLLYASLWKETLFWVYTAHESRNLYLKIYLWRLSEICVSNFCLQPFSFNQPLASSFQILKVKFSFFGCDTASYTIIN